MGSGQDLPISGLPAASLPLSGAELVPLVQGGVTRQVECGVFGQVLYALVTRARAADFPLTTLVTNGASSAVVLFSLTSTVVRSDPAAGSMEFLVGNTDQGGALVSNLGSLDLSAAGRFPESVVLELEPGTTLKLQVNNVGGFGAATYAFSVSVLLIN